MRITSSAFANNFLLQVNQLQQQQNQLQNEAATGQKISLPEDDPAAMTEVLNLQTTAAANTQYQNNASAVQSSATTTYGAMNSLKTITDRLGQIATLAANSNNSPAQFTAYSKEVANLMQEALQAGNTQDANGNYIFGGTKTSAPPFVATTDASNNVTAVSYQGNASVAQTEIAPNVFVSAGVPGANTTGSGPAGLFSDSSSGADLFNDMISLQQHLNAAAVAPSGDTTAITAISTTDAPALNKDDDNVISQISANGVLQSTLTNATNLAAAKGLNLTSQISGDTNADLATVLTQLTQTQTAYQAALESGSKIMSLSLLDFLQ